MQELRELRALIEPRRYPEALVLLGELDEMGHEDKVNKIGGFLTILLLHLIKQHAEQRSTRAWEVSIRNALREITATNKRRKAGGYYLAAEELQEALNERYVIALDLASIEAFEGRYDPPELAELVDEGALKEQALRMILEAQ